MSPRLAAGKKDYNLAMDPALLAAGKVVAAAEDRSLAVLLRHLLKQHIERHGDAQAQHIYSTGAEMPHGTRIDRFGKPKDVTVQMPDELYQRALAVAQHEERSMNSFIRRALERYIEESQSEEAPEGEDGALST